MFREGSTPLPTSRPPTPEPLPTGLKTNQRPVPRTHVPVPQRSLLLRPSGSSPARRRPRDQLLLCLCRRKSCGGCSATSMSASRQRAAITPWASPSSGSRSGASKRRLERTMAASPTPLERAVITGTTATTVRDARSGGRHRGAMVSQFPTSDDCPIGCSVWQRCDRRLERSSPGKTLCRALEGDRRGKGSGYHWVFSV
jgi:hypothetical protein